MEKLELEDKLKTFQKRVKNYRFLQEMAFRRAHESMRHATKYGQTAKTYEKKVNSLKIKWAKEFLEKYNEVQKTFNTDNYNLVFCFLPSHKGAFAQCSRKDRYIPIVGKAIALARALNVEDEIPNFI